MQIEIPDECRDWVEWIVNDFSATEIIGTPNDELVRMFVPQDDEQEWVRNVVREMCKAFYPAARLEITSHLTPRQIGGLLGQRYALFCRMGEPNPMPELDLEKLLAGMTPEQAKAGEALQESLESIAEDIYPCTARALALALAQPHQQASEFMSAFAKGLARKPRDLTARHVGRMNTVLLLWLFMWREHIGAKRQFNSVSKVYEFLRPLLPKRRVRIKAAQEDLDKLERKRIEKMLQRLKIPFDQPKGRPPRQPGNSDKN